MTSFLVSLLRNADGSGVKNNSDFSIEVRGACGHKRSLESIFKDWKDNLIVLCGVCNRFWVTESHEPRITQSSLGIGNPEEYIGEQPIIHRRNFKTSLPVEIMMEIFRYHVSTVNEYLCIMSLSKSIRRYICQESGFSAIQFECYNVGKKNVLPSCPVPFVKKLLIVGMVGSKNIETLEISKLFPKLEELTIRWNERMEKIEFDDDNSIKKLRVQCSAGRLRGKFSRLEELECHRHQIDDFLDLSSGKERFPLLKRLRIIVPPEFKPEKIENLFEKLPSVSSIHIGMFHQPFRDNICMICLDETFNYYGAIKGCYSDQILVTSVCGHYFHNMCVRMWCQRSTRLCPIDRSEFLPSFVDPCTFIKWEKRERVKKEDL